MELTLSKADSRPMYLQIMDRLREEIRVGNLMPGDQLPSIRELAVSLKVSVITVKRAYLELEHEKVIQVRHGKGSFVAEPNDSEAPNKDLADLHGALEASAAIAVEIGLSEDAFVAEARQAIARKKETES